MITLAHKYITAQFPGLVHPKSNIKIVKKEAKLILLANIYMNAQFPVLSQTLQ